MYIITYNIPFRLIPLIYCSLYTANKCKCKNGSPLPCVLYAAVCASVNVHLVCCTICWIQYVCRDTVLFTRELYLKKKREGSKESDLTRFQWKLPIQGFHRWFCMGRKKGGEKIAAVSCSLVRSLRALYTGGGGGGGRILCTPIHMYPFSPFIGSTKWEKKKNRKIIARMRSRGIVKSETITESW